MDGERVRGRSLGGRWWLALLLCLVLIAAGTLAGAVTVQTQGHATWLNAGTSDSSPCGSDSNNTAHICCGATAGCSSLALSDVDAVPAVSPAHRLLVGPLEASPAGHLVAPPYHPPRLS